MLSGAVSAETRVRSGEHPGFTRLVIDFDRRPMWRLGRVGEGYELRTDARTGFDLSDVFRRLDAGRLTEIRNHDGGTVAFSLGCRCRLEVVELPNQGLMIDIVDGAPSPGARFERRLDGPVNAETTAEVSEKLTLPVVFPQPRLLPSHGPMAELGHETPSQLQDVHRTLIAQVARGVSQGVTDLHMRLPEQIPVFSVQPEDDPTPARQDPDGGGNIRIETQIDRDRRQTAGQSYSVAEGPCIAADTLDVGAWFNPEIVIQGFGEARVNLVDVRDRPVNAGYRNLARQMIYMTFGAEARALLRSVRPGQPDDALLGDIARIMDDGDVPRESALHSQLDCDTSVAIWGLLADKSGQHKPLARNAVIATFSAWPSHLRRHLGPRVASALLQRGDRDGALAIRNAIERGGSDPSPGATMVAAELDLDADNRVSAEAKLAEVSASRSKDAARAMVELLKSQIASESPVTLSFIENAQALTSEIRLSEMAAPLATATVQALIHNGSIKEALEYLREMKARGFMNIAAAEPLRSAALVGLAERSDDTEFLSVGLPEIARQPLIAPARLPLAERLAALRMPAQARAALGDITEIPTARERILRARLALLEDAPRIAESYLAGLADPEAVELVTIARSLPDPSGDVVQPDEMPGTSDTADTLGVLAANKALLSESRARRQALSDLLGAE
ncbi:hypothetical protein [Oceaniglobus indicus]|uniref:hypothetical protein n=1 Tax=Oceaniglobus indicus TaxID=2047749 RepID=UPI0011AB8621|nr:hypothetical protein [Oceaniglobus indicus]